MSHRSYQPTQSCGSKLLQQRWDKTYYEEHRRLVKSAKPTVDTSAPRKPPHVIAKWKKQQLEKERAEEIERDNHTLMSRMSKIMHTQTTPDQHKHHSLNEEKRQRELERVARENKAMLQRLQKVQPVYRTSDWIDDWQKSEELSQRITTYPSPSSTHTGRSKSAPHRLRQTTTSDPQRDGMAAGSATDSNQPGSHVRSDPATSDPPGDGEGGEKKAELEATCKSTTAEKQVTD